MTYSTWDYLKDLFWGFDFLSRFFKSIKPKISSVVRRILTFEYDYYVERVVGNIPYAMLIIFLGFFAVFTLGRITEKGNGVKITTITTASMNPAILPGSVVFISPQDSYHKGDIVSYKEINLSTNTETGRSINHRLIEEKEAGRFIAKGDANEFPDPGEIQNESITGKVFLVIPYVGYIDLILRTIPGFIFFIALPAFFIIRSEILYIRSELRRSKYYNRVTAPVASSTSQLPDAAELS